MSHSSRSISRTRRSLRAVASFAFLLAVAPASAQTRVIDFADYVNPEECGDEGCNPTIRRQGYVFSCLSTGEGNEGLTCGDFSGGPFGAGGNVLVRVTNIYGAVRLAREEGGAFDLLGLSFARSSDDAPSYEVELLGRRVRGGFARRTVMVGGAPFVLTAFDLGDAFAGMSWVRWRAGGFGPEPADELPYFDDVVVRDDHLTVAPEPGTVGLVAGRLAALGAAGRVRRRRT
jgi:hypothetical protein